MKVLPGLAIAVAASVAAACGGAQAPPPTTAPPSDPASGSATATVASCDDVVAHVKQLSIAASGATTDEQKEHAARDVEPALVELADECEGGNGATPWPPTFRSCVIGAKTREDVAVCDRANSGAAP